MLQIKKRNGIVVPFDRERIINAINKAFIEVDGELYEDDTANDIADEIKYAVKTSDDVVSVEKIQDMVEDFLMKSERRDVAKAYIRYRYKREIARKGQDDFMKAFSAKVQGSDIENQNANVDEMSFGGRVGAASDLQMKKYALDYLVSNKSRANHENNEIYIHDLNAYAVGMHNCLSIPFDDLLAKGFNTRQTDVRPAGSVNTAFQLVAVIFQLQSLQQFGGVSATHLDWTMIPYVRKSFYKHYMDGLTYIEQVISMDDRLNNQLSIEDPIYKEFKGAYSYAIAMTEKEVHQAVEGMYHNLNTLQSRSGNQLPFTSINYGTCTLPEGRMVTKALLEVSIEGLGRLHKTSIFPCGIFQCMKGVNRKPGDPNYDLFRLALKSTATRLYPNYANVDWSGNAGYDVNDPSTYFSTMGCRTANGFDINGLKQQKDGRGNICPVTIIMPTIAMEANGDVETFMKLLDIKIEEAKDMLLERFEYICAQPADSAKFMYENGLMAGYDGISTRSALQHGTLSLGQIGLAETLQILIGCDHTEPEGMKLAKRIEQLFKDRCAEYKEKYRLNFGVYYTPAENLCYTSLKKFRDKYGIIPNVSDREFFTNSMHVPVWHQLSPFDKIDIESQLTGYSSAGCITYVELDTGMEKNIDAMETLVNYAMDKDIPYFAINVPCDTCLNCGYTGEFNDKCPQCGSKEIQQLRRVTGYLTGNYKTAFNKGKQDEVNNRVKHVGYME
jgi:ribonucleoside-triphosphate reductase|nr:MAG TPA: anaerobic ribonucleoside triphosphate reductase [Caudoviricetes sp.]